MSKVAQAAKALNDGLIALPAPGRRVETQKFAIHHRHSGFCQVFNITPRLGRIGCQIGYLRLNPQGMWESRTT